MDYLDFICELDKIWTEKDNSKLSREYSMNRSVLPALIKLNREWKSVFNIQVKINDDLELKLNHFTSIDTNIDKSYDLEKTVNSLRKQLKKLEDEKYLLKDEVRKVESNFSEYKRSSIFHKMIG